jgi:hypothetical protein
MPITWEIRRNGRAWKGDEMRARWERTPEKFEVYKGKLFWSKRARLHLLAMLLENEGADAAVHIGDPGIWKDAVARL